MHVQLLILLLFARVWQRGRELLLPISFLLLLLASVPQFVSYIFLVSTVGVGAMACLCAPVSALPAEGASQVDNIRRKQQQKQRQWSLVQQY